MTTTPTFEIVREILIDAPPERVFALLTDMSLLRTWMPMTRFEARIGGGYTYEVGDWVAAGTVVELDPPRRLVYTWDWRNEPMGVQTLVEFTLTPSGSGTLVELKHHALPSEDYVDSHARGWDHVMPRLADVAVGRDPGPARVLEAVFGQ